ncbi:MULTISPECIES: TrkA C-terminal domain-containing protein [Clostridium]|uniref:GntR family transcriptional regulator n=2 Tax=Clostridiaceae TaxID=31979 RepID=A0A6B4P629_CLOBO|nr:MULTISPECIES: TrkA C-terminal domain-containing protein [Clostridium]ACD52703.1 transcriptional regulator, GntR family [Clostridium botulinum E3 str. Alaska E43]AJF30503.1 GntR family transcriptional regulator [Clostridium botulinum]AJF33566.1 GntR family transcriptional regulator [Clostridium botulinum]KIL07744.1 GntR family transcriptional regulator [Clostridium botulinum]MBN1043065.1 GntR family transcriptional regulator [Clostridium botulinum]
MKRSLKIVSPVYQQIAADIASKIANGHYKVGEKIYARSALAAQYSVSSETARRAICILSDMEIVDTAKGSGVTIKSCQNAIKFVKQYEDIQTVNDLKKEILGSIERQTLENKYLKEHLLDLIDKTDRFKSINPFIPFEININKSTPYIGKNISEINFWHNTFATIIAIKRGESLVMSPGPYAIFREGDIFYFVGDEDCYERVHNFMYPQ